MRMILAIALLIGFTVVASAEDVVDTPKTRRVAATQYANTQDVSQMLRDSVEHLMRSIPSDQQSDFRRLMLEHVQVDFIRELMIAAMAKHFTTAELNALADFYGSEVGRSAATKFGAYMGDVIPMIHVEMRRALSELQSQKSVEAQRSGT